MSAASTERPAAGHRHFMHQEIFEQPAALARSLEGRLDAARGEVVLDRAMLEAAARAPRVSLTACGSSYNVCRIARGVIEDLAQLPCDLELASEMRFRRLPTLPGAVTVTVSQSGETADTLAAMQAARAHGSRIACIVNVPDSAMARAADWVLPTMAGREVSVAATKSFLNQVATALLLGMGIAQRRGASPERVRELGRALAELPRVLEQVLRVEAQAAAAVPLLAQAPSALVLGRSHGYAIALEAALKLKETAYLHAEGYAAGELRHGPIALLAPGLPVVAIALDGLERDAMLQNLRELRAMARPIVALVTEGDAEIPALADHTISVPRVDSFLAPLVAAVPLQLLAYHLAAARGAPIDHPRNLSKALVTD